MISRTLNSQNRQEGKHMTHPLTERELKADRPVSNFPVNHGGLKQRTKQQEALIVVCIKLDTEKHLNVFISL